MAMTLAPLALQPLPPDHIRPLADSVYERLVGAIVDGSLPPGGKLSERSIAAALGISAQPVREALRRLEGEGMVETRPRSGSSVARMDTRRLAEMGRIRAVLEGAAAGSCRPPRHARGPAKPGATAGGDARRHRAR
jgi:DNA-binding GntR family transcriptional regulator